MRRITMLALAAVLVAFTGAACGGDDDDDATDTTQATDDGSTTDDGGDTDGSTDADIAAGFLDDDCQFLLAGVYLNPLAAATAGAATDELEEAQDKFEAIKDDAPDEIQDAMETVSTANQEFAEALGDVDLSDPQSLADPDVQQKFQELSDTFGEDYEDAAQTISDYVEENCSG